MGRAEDRKAIVAAINQAAELYRRFLVGKSFMYVFDDRYIEVIYKTVNFKHLTGVDSHLPANQFFKLASKGKLAASQIDFSNRHPYTLCPEKLPTLFSLRLLQPPSALCSKTYQQKRSAISLEQQTCTFPYL